MQITLIRNGKHDKNGHLTHDGIEDGIGAGFLLGNAAVGQQFKVPQVDWVLLHDDGNIAPIYSLPAQYQCPVQIPDLILTSSELPAKEMGFAVWEQLKHAHIKPDIRYNIAYLNKFVSDDYKIDQYGCIDSKVAEKLYASKQIQDTIGFIQRLEKEGKQHVVIISAEPNIHILLNLLGSEDIVKSVSKNGIAYTFFSVNADKIGKEKYLCQRRYLKSGMIRNSFLNNSILGGMYVESISDIEWKMPDFLFIDRMQHLNKLRQNDKQRG